MLGGAPSLILENHKSRSKQLLPPKAPRRTWPSAHRTWMIWGFKSSPFLQPEEPTEMPLWVTGAILPPKDLRDHGRMVGSMWKWNGSAWISQRRPDFHQRRDGEFIGPSVKQQIPNISLPRSFKVSALPRHKHTSYKAMLESKKFPS